MQQSLSIVVYLCAISRFHQSAIPLAHLPSAFVVGLLWIPAFAVLTLAWPEYATTTQTSTGAWRPTGLQTANNILAAVLVVCMSSEMAFEAGAAKELATTFEIYLDPPPGFSPFRAAAVSVAAVMAFGPGEKVSFSVGYRCWNGVWPESEASAG